MIGFRWRTAGGDKHPFDQDALAAIFKYSRGLPRKICKLCDNALIRVKSSGVKDIDKNIIDLVAEEIRLAQEAEQSPSSRQPRRKGKTKK